MMLMIFKPLFVQENPNFITNLKCNVIREELFIWLESSLRHHELVMKFKQNLDKRRGFSLILLLMRRRSRGYSSMNIIERKWLIPMKNLKW
jgi:hypothetical protein